MKCSSFEKSLTLPHCNYRYHLGTVRALLFHLNDSATLTLIKCFIYQEIQKSISFLVN